MVDGERRRSAIDEATGRTGRPVDRAKDAAVLRTTLDALAEGGYDEVTIDAVAATTGVAKTTIYRRWPSKADLVHAAVVSAGRPPEADSLPDRGSLRADLLAMVDSPWLGGPKHRLAIFAGLASATRVSGDLAEVIREQITEPYIETYRALLERAADRDLVPAANRPRIPLIARVIPALSTQQISGHRPTERADYIAIIDDVVLPALGLH